jgi:glycosyltransferase involved in cell wall biosynthesis
VLNYAVLIRTRGTGGEKYEKTLKCIDALNPKPNEVIISLPNGVNPPKEKLGYENFVFGKGGFIHQWLNGVDACNSDYILFLDDDISFNPNLAEKLAEPLIDGICKVSYPPLDEQLPHGRSVINSALARRAVPILFDKKHHLKVLASTGYKYRRIEKKSPKYLFSQTAPGACFFAERKTFKEIDMHAELWSDRYPYSGEDQILFYKFYLYGANPTCVTDGYIEHLDIGSENPQKTKNSLFGSGYFRPIFFDRFILTQAKNPFKKFICKFSYYYTKNVSNLFLIIGGFIKKSKKDARKYAKEGELEAKKFMASDDYKNLPSVKIKIK